MSNENTISEVNAKRLLWAGFMAILAAGVGFAIRGGIFDNWQLEYGFTATQLGAIGGMGFSGFCFGIIIGGVVVDKIGYGKLVFAAFLFHFLSALVTFTAGGDSAYTSLAWGMFIFAFANGTLEAVANPLIATLFPQNRNHYLNILHASWPAGLVLGGIIGWVLDDKFEWKWQYQLALYLVPTVIYGLMFMGQKYPKSEAAQKGLSLGEMFKEVGILGGLVVCYLLVLFFQGILPDGYSLVSWLIGGALLVTIAVITGFSVGHWLIFVLFITHALVGAVELGTDGWIQNITGNMLSSEEGKILFVWTSACMFGLRFCAHWMEKTLKIKPITLLFICAVMACIGLNLVSGATAFTGAIIALTIYGFGKTFFWPTMLAVASDRFPRSGAIAISIMGGIGMMSSGLLGSPGLGYAKDRFSGEALNESNAALYAEYKAETTSKWLFLSEVNGLDAKKLGAIGEKETPTDDEKAVQAASIEGDRRTLKADSFIPAAMAVIYLLLMVYFKSIGGYKPVTIEEQKE
jgi:MFS family permease